MQEILSGQMKENLSTHPLQQFSHGLWAGGAYKYPAVKGKGGAGDTGNRWVHFQPSGKGKTTPGAPEGFQVLPHHSPWARGCRQALTVLGSICQPQHNVITDAQTKQHRYAQALRQGAKHAGDQTAMTCVRALLPLHKAFCRETEPAQHPSARCCRGEGKAENSGDGGERAALVPPRHTNASLQKPAAHYCSKSLPKKQPRTPELPAEGISIHPSPTPLAQVWRLLLWKPARGNAWEKTDLAIGEGRGPSLLCLSVCLSTLCPGRDSPGG